MSKYDDSAKAWRDECIETLEEAKTKADEAIEGSFDQFRQNSLGNIPQQFGEFLYTALGDRVTGQRCSVVNKTYFETSNKGLDVANRASNAEMTIEDYLSDPRKSWNHRHIQLYITTGRKFGVSYFTGDSKRVHTIYVGKAGCFKYLTQEHVDCIKNKQKRKCAQDFLDFRNDYVTGMENLTDCLVDTKVPIKLGVVSCLTKSKKINSYAGSYRDNTVDTYVVMDGVAEDTITHTIATIQTEKVWDKISALDSRSVKRDHLVSPSFISLVFLNIDDEKKTIKVIGNVDMDMIDSCSVHHTLQVATDFSNRRTLNHSDACNIGYQITREPALKAYVNNSVEDCGGIILNMDEIIQNPLIRNELDKRVKFYNDMSDRLQRLKHEHATLYFVNADI